MLHLIHQIAYKLNLMQIEDFFTRFKYIDRQYYTLCNMERRRMKKTALTTAILFLMLTSAILPLAFASPETASDLIEDGDFATWLGPWSYTSSDDLSVSHVSFGNPGPSIYLFAGIMVSEVQTFGLTQDVDVTSGTYSSATISIDYYASQGAVWDFFWYFELSYGSDTYTSPTFDVDFGLSWRTSSDSSADLVSFLNDHAGKSVNLKLFATILTDVTNRAIYFDNLKLDVSFIEQTYIVEIGIAQFQVEKDFDPFPRPGAADPNFKFNLLEVDDDFDSDTLPDEDWFIAPKEAGFLRILFWGGYDIDIADDELYRSYPGPIYVPKQELTLPIDLQIEVWDNDFLGFADLMIRVDASIESLPFEQTFEDEGFYMKLVARSTPLISVGSIPSGDEDLWYLYEIDADDVSSEYTDADFDSVRVAIIDTGIDPTIEGLVGKIVYWEDLADGEADPYDDVGHGTEVASIITGEAGGIAENVELIVIRVPTSGYPWETTAIVNSIAEAINLAVDQDAEVVSLSLGLSERALSQDNIDTLQRAADNAYTEGVVIVAAAGNDRTCLEQYPAHFEEVISVSALLRFSPNLSYDSIYDVASRTPEAESYLAFADVFSNFGTDYAQASLSTELTAPGAQIRNFPRSFDLEIYPEPGLETYPDPRYTTAGTSFSCPIVSAVAALIIGYAKNQYGVDLTPTHVRRILRASAVDLGPSGWDQYYGYGMVNAHEALQKVDELLSTRNVDVVLLIDRSGSMWGSKIRDAKTSAIEFVDLMRPDDMIGIASYSSTARVDYGLSNIIDSVSRGILAPEQIAFLIANRLDDETAAIMVAIALAESGGDSEAMGDPVDSYPVEYSCNGYTSIGLWQIHMPAHFDKLERHTSSSDPCVWAEWLKDPWNNAEVALEILETQGLTAWTTYNNGAYQHHLGHAEEAVKKAKSGGLREEVENVINAISASGMTAMGDGLRTAYNQLVNYGDPSHPWAIVLLSNGWHNWGSEHPYNVIPDLKSMNIKVYTIGIGAGADANLLGKIASDTGGFYRFAATSEDLLEIYNDIRVAVAQEQTVSFVAGSVAQGETSQVSVPIDSSVTRATFTLSWAGSNLDLTLTRPDGTLIDPEAAAVDPHIDYVEKARYEFYRVQNPAAGTWTMNILGISVPPATEPFIAQVSASTNVVLNLYTDKDSYVYPESVAITATLEDWGTPVTGATVEAQMTRPDSSETTIELFDDGQHDDCEEDDGVYSNYFNQYNEDGSYTIRVISAGITLTGEPFTRESQKSILISGVPTDTTPPKTTTFIGFPQHIDTTGNLYVTSDTLFTLEAVDNNGAGSGVAETRYRIYNATFNTGWVISVPPITFQITGLTDDVYNVDYYSIDNAGNVESTNTQAVILDDTPPTTTLTIGEPKYIDAGNTYITSETPFTLAPTDDTGSGVASTTYKISNGTYDSGWITYTDTFTLPTWLNNDAYHITYNSTDNLGNIETENVFTVLLRNPVVNTCMTDDDFNKITRFQAVFEAEDDDDNDGTKYYELEETIPEEFCFNILVENAWPLPLNMTITYEIDPAFMADVELEMDDGEIEVEGINVYKKRVTRRGRVRWRDITERCEFCNDTITVYDVPSGGIIYITIELEYSLIGTRYTETEVEGWYSEHTFSATVSPITSSVTIIDPELIRAPRTPNIIMFNCLLLYLGLVVALLRQRTLTRGRRKEN